MERFPVWQEQDGIRIRPDFVFRLLMLIMTREPSFCVHSPEDWLRRLCETDNGQTSLI